MPGSLPRDLAVVDHWSTSLERSRARRARASKRRLRQSVHPTSALALLLDVREGMRQPRDLAEEEPWQLSLGRSRARRRARNLQFVPTSSRAKRVSLGALAALSVGPAVGLASGHSGHGSPNNSNPEPATTTEHVITLSSGSEGRQVRLLQQALGIKVDGIYGPETEAAVRAFQASRGVNADGVFGAQTSKALRAALAGKAMLSDLMAPTPGAPPAPTGAPEAAAGEASTAASQEAAPAGQGTKQGEAPSTVAEGTGGTTTPVSANGGAAAGTVQSAADTTTGTTAGTTTDATSASGGAGAGTPAPQEEATSSQEGAPAPGVAAPATVEAVQELQAALHLPVDGDYGPETDAAVRRLQARHGLSADGVVGAATWAVIGVKGKATLSPPAAANAAVSEPGANSQTRAIEQLQTALRLPPTGQFTSETETAVRRLQERNGLKVDGVVGPQTWSAVGVQGEETLTPPPSAVPQPAAVPQQEAGAAAGAAAAQTGLTPGSGGTVNPVQTTPVAPSSAVEWLQAALHVPVDGEFGAETEAAVRRLQARHGLNVDGVVGPATWALIGVQGAPTLTPPASAVSQTPVGVPGATSTAGLGGGEAEGVVARVIAAADEIATRPYVYGGGHGSFESVGYDCSGSVSYALHGGGLLSSPEDSTGLESYGEAGPGRYITIYANAEHAYMVIDGKRFDTVALAEDGSRWSGSPGEDGGDFVERHPDGL
jgi:peptidoglycan hydrolase-like protein with peptidoglycan-binding domain